MNQSAGWLKIGSSILNDVYILSCVATGRVRIWIMDKLWKDHYVMEWASRLDHVVVKLIEDA
jgi:hypothetical protein